MLDSQVGRRQVGRQKKEEGEGKKKRKRKRNRNPGASSCD